MWDKMTKSEISSDKENAKANVMLNTEPEEIKMELP